MDCVVIDHGSTSVKAGFAGEDQPSCVVPTVVGQKGSQNSPYASFAQQSESGSARDKKQRNSVQQDIVGSSRESNIFVGKEAMARQDQLDLLKPIQRGEIQDWETMKSVWDHIFDHQLQIEPDSMPVLLTDQPLSSKESREQMTQIMFENYNVPGLYIASKSVLSLFATGRTRGIVVGLGGGVTSVVPVFEGFALPHATKRFDFAGEDLTDFLQQKINLKLSRDIVQDIKEKTCSVLPYAKRNIGPWTGASPNKSRLKSSMSSSSKNGFSASFSSSSSSSSPLDGMSKDPRSEDQSIAPVPYELPDGTIVEISPDCQHSIPEALFNPSITKNHSSIPGIGKVTFDSIQSCDKTLQADLFGSVIISGGSSMFPGFASRLESELGDLCSNSNNNQSQPSKIQVIPDSQRKVASWIGGSMLASLETFPQIYISKQEFEEHGSRIVTRKSFC